MPLNFHYTSTGSHYLEKEMGLPSPILQVYNWLWCSGFPNGVLEEKPGPKVPSAHSLSVYPGRLHKETGS